MGCKTAAFCNTFECRSSIIFPKCKHNKYPFACFIKHNTKHIYYKGAQKNLHIWVCYKGAIKMNQLTLLLSSILLSTFMAEFMTLLASLLLCANTKSPLRHQPSLLRTSYKGRNSLLYQHDRHYAFFTTTSTYVDQENPYFYMKTQTSWRGSNSLHCRWDFPFLNIACSVLKSQKTIFEF